MIVQRNILCLLEIIELRIHFYYVSPRAYPDVLIAEVTEAMHAEDAEVVGTKFCVLCGDLLRDFSAIKKSGHAPGD